MASQGRAEARVVSFVLSQRNLPKQDPKGRVGSEGALVECGIQVGLSGPRFGVQASHAPSAALKATTSGNSLGMRLDHEGSGGDLTVLIKIRCRLRLIWRIWLCPLASSPGRTIRTTRDQEQKPHPRLSFDFRRRLLDPGSVYQRQLFGAAQSHSHRLECSEAVRLELGIRPPALISGAPLLPGHCVCILGFSCFGIKVEGLGAVGVQC